MKKLLKIAMCVVAIGFYGTTYAQQKKPSTLKKDASELKQDVKSTAGTVAKETSEVASKGYAKITDKTYKDKVGPAGQTVYIDSHSKYYYVDNAGKKVFVTMAQLKK